MSHHPEVPGQSSGSNCLGRSVAQVVGVSVAVVLVVIAVRFAPRSVSANDDRPTGLVNPIDQRNTMITELRELNARLARIEKRLGAEDSGNQ